MPAVCRTCRRRNCSLRDLLPRYKYQMALKLWWRPSADALRNPRNCVSSFAWLPNVVDSSDAKAMVSLASKPSGRASSKFGHSPAGWLTCDQRMPYELRVILCVKLRALSYFFKNVQSKSLCSVSDISPEKHNFVSGAINKMVWRLISSDCCWASWVKHIVSSWNRTSVINDSVF